MTVEDDWTSKSGGANVLNKRTTLNWGNRQSLAQLASAHYDLPTDIKGNSTTFGYYLWMTQIQQGKCMQYLFENNRRKRSKFDKNNKMIKRGTMGSVYWQFNNNWPTVSWATLDHSGNWKVSHNMVEQMFRDVLITCWFDKTKKYTCNVVNDRPHELKDARVIINAFSYDQQNNVPKV